ncbi:hypothetical protein P4056_14680 [Pseudomonas aeruginosa]|nr:hypothetical protein [Pseudomonas aeruginosa]
MSSFQQHLHQAAQQRALPFQKELYVDLFAGAGGASSGALVSIEIQTLRSTTTPLPLPFTEPITRTPSTSGQTFSR